MPDAITGANAVYGRDVMDGVNLAVNAVNAAGGVKVGSQHLKVVMQFCDDQYMSPLALQCGQKLQAQNKPPIMLAPETISGAPLLNLNTTAPKFLVIASAGAPSFLDSKNPLVARMYYNAPGYMPTWIPLIEQAVKTYNLTLDTVGIMQSDDVFGQAWSQGFSAAWTSAGHPAPKVAVYEDAATNFLPQLTSLIASHPDAIGITQSCPIAAQIITQAQQLGFKGRFIFQNSCAPSGLVQYIAESKFEGGIFEAPGFSVPTTYTDAFTTKYKAAYNLVPSAGSSYGYGLVNWAMSSVTAAGTTDPTAVRAVLAKVLDSPDSASWNLNGFFGLGQYGEINGIMNLAYVQSATNTVLIKGTKAQVTK